MKIQDAGAPSEASQGFAIGQEVARIGTQIDTVWNIIAEGVKGQNAIRKLAHIVEDLLTQRQKELKKLLK